MGSSDDSGSDYRSDSDSGSDDSDSHHDAPPSAKPPKPLASSAPVTAVHIPIAAAPSAAAAPTSHVHMQPHVQSQSLLTLQQVQRLQAQYEVQRRAQLQAQGAGGSGANEAGVGPYSAGGAAGAAGGVLGGPPSRKAVVTPLAQLFQSLATTNAWIATTGQSYHHSTLHDRGGGCWCCCCCFPFFLSSHVLTLRDCCFLALILCRESINQLSFAASSWNEKHIYICLKNSVTYPLRSRSFFHKFPPHPYPILQFKPSRVGLISTASTVNTSAANSPRSAKPAPKDWLQFGPSSSRTATLQFNLQRIRIRIRIPQCSPQRPLGRR